MGLVPLPGLGIEYFSFSEEIQSLTAMFFEFIVNISTGWVILITAFTIVFIAVGVIYRLGTEIKEAGM